MLRRPRQPAAQTETAVTPAEPDKIAALKPEQSLPAEAAKPPEAAQADIAAPELLAPREAAPQQADTPAAAEPAKMAAIAEVVPPAQRSRRGRVLGAGHGPRIRRTPISSR